jgi:hypothetical protein
MISDPVWLDSRGWNSKKDVLYSPISSAPAFSQSLVLLDKHRLWQGLPVGSLDRHVVEICNKLNSLTGLGFLGDDAPRLGNFEAFAFPSVAQNESPLVRIEGRVAGSTVALNSFSVQVDKSLMASGRVLIRLRRDSEFGVVEEYCVEAPKDGSPVYFPRSLERDVGGDMSLYRLDSENQHWNLLHSQKFAWIRGITVGMSTGGAGNNELFSIDEKLADVSWQQSEVAYLGATAHQRAEDSSIESPDAQASEEARLIAQALKPESSSCAWFDPGQKGIVAFAGWIKAKISEGSKVLWVAATPDKAVSDVLESQSQLRVFVLKASREVDDEMPSSKFQAVRKLDACTIPDSIVVFERFSGVSKCYYLSGGPLGQKALIAGPVTGISKEKLVSLAKNSWRDAIVVDGVQSVASKAIARQPSLEWENVAQFTASLTDFDQRRAVFSELWNSTGSHFAELWARLCRSPKEIRNPIVDMFFAQEGACDRAGELVLGMPAIPKPVGLIGVPDSPESTWLALLVRQSLFKALDDAFSISERGFYLRGNSGPASIKILADELFRRDLSKWMDLVVRMTKLAIEHAVPDRLVSELCIPLVSLRLGYELNYAVLLKSPLGGIRAVAASFLVQVMRNRLREGQRDAALECIEDLSVLPEPEYVSVLARIVYDSRVAANRLGGNEDEEEHFIRLACFERIVRFWPSSWDLAFLSSVADYCGGPVEGSWSLSTSQELLEPLISGRRIQRSDVADLWLGLLVKHIGAQSQGNGQFYADAHEDLTQAAAEYAAFSRTSGWIDALLTIKNAGRSILQRPFARSTAYSEWRSALVAAAWIDTFARLVERRASSSDARPWETLFNADVRQQVLDSDEEFLGLSSFVRSVAQAE